MGVRVRAKQSVDLALPPPFPSALQRELSSEGTTESKVYLWPCQEVRTPVISPICIQVNPCAAEGALQGGSNLPEEVWVAFSD